MISGINSGLSLSRLYDTTTTAGSSSARRAGHKGGAPPAITLTTQEGDTVTFTPKAQTSATYARPTSGGSLASLNLQSNDQFDVTITGNLSDQEKSDIQATLAKMDGAKSVMDSGDMTAGMAAMQSAMQASGTVASVSRPTGPPPGGGPLPGGAPPSGASGASAASGTSSTDTLLSLLDSDSDSDSSSLASLLKSFTQKSTGTSDTTSSSSSTNTLEDFLQQVLNGLRTGATSTVASSS